MSVLIPLMFNENWCSMAPSHIMDHKYGFGMDLDELLSSIIAPRRNPADSKPCQAAKSEGNSIVNTDKNKFQVNLDVQQFKPEEITVKVTGENTITVEAKHEEEHDVQGFVSRHFIRRFTLPQGHDVNNVVSNLSSDGVLSITAPPTRKQVKEEERTIPIQLQNKTIADETNINI